MAGNVNPFACPVFPFLLSHRRISAFRGLLEQDCLMAGDDGGRDASQLSRSAKDVAEEYEEIVSVYSDDEDSDQSNPATSLGSSADREDEPGTPDAVPSSPDKLHKDSKKKKDALLEVAAAVKPRKNSSLYRNRKNPNKRQIVTHSADSEVSEGGFKEYPLRLTDSEELRDYIVANFSVIEPPTLSSSSTMRLFRERESTVLGRKKAIKKNHEQTNAASTILGRQKELIYDCQGNVYMPYRYQSNWNMDVSEGQTSREESRTSELSDVDCFQGTPMGQTTSRYAIIVLSEDIADVTLLDPYSWNAFRRRERAVEKGGPTPEKEQKMKKAEEAREKVIKNVSKKMEHFTEKFDKGQAEHDKQLGDGGRINALNECAPIGLARNRKQKLDNSEAEGLDFNLEEEFDNDDVRLNDELDEEIEDENEERRYEKERNEAEKAYQNKKGKKKKFRALQTDTLETSDTDSEEEQPSLQVSKRPTRKKRNTSGKATRERAAGKDTRKGAKSNTAKKSQSKTTLPDLSHLLPSAGTLPSVKHAQAVLAALIEHKKGKEVLLREWKECFETETAVQTKNLRAIFPQAGKFLRAKDKKGTTVMYVRAINPPGMQKQTADSQELPEGSR